ncbi:MAG: ATP-dependent DNA helicase, partial [Alphaproteobacteria bacterium]|nr:ATP-dependent DNA helicase [Alphaproteobacteria bacterium]MDX5369607.1 ATP-dependent DNA helicase [Alphaproteobacteria bacterium]MDX5464258.1 ATP-dependent DNA helicase [Alphaproteobacteria bacterium]
MEGAPNVVLAEAGTGIGKTLGYLAPASVWAEKNDGAVWVSTYTKALQRQIDRELDRLYPDPREKRARAVVRKGRENYLCLLNYQEAVGRAATGGSDPVALGFVARWLVATRDGDVIGGDLPGWLPDLMGGAFSGLTDRRGECIYSACEHYRRCFIERTVRRARGADIVVANHALVMAQAALDALIDAPDEDGVSEARTRLVFDEGHHLFEAADSAFSACLSGLETAELRRWVRGGESRRRRGRGLETRLADLIAAIPEDAPREKAEGALRAARARAADLPGEGWTSRIREGTPAGPAETLLAGLMAHVRARSPEGAGLAQEAELRPLTDGLAKAAEALAAVLDDLAGNLRALSGALRARLTNEADTLDTAERTRLAAAARGLDRRAKVMLPTWISMLRGIDADPPEGAVDWVSVDPVGGRALDVALRRHLLDPMAPFAVSVLAPSHGALITSATLRDRELDAAQDGNWVSAEARTGARHLPLPAIRASFASPFDYGAETRVFIVTDVRRDEPSEVAAAYEALIRAAGGGTLGLFTAIRRLKAVHERIAPKLEGDGLPLYAQHVDAMDVGGLVDLFREEEDASLLGTDAVRDGVDVPGRALRLAVFDRVPWPRPDILHKARRAHFGRRTYDDMLVRLRLAQAFGRLIRRQGDRGVFVLLDAMTPSRLLTAFPPETPVARVGLAEAVGETRAFLHRRAGDLP